MGKPQEGNQKGAQRHAEGQRGEKAQAAFMDEITDHSRREDRGSKRDAHDPNLGGHGEGERELHERLMERGGDGRHRLVEDRKQHDEAEKNSEKNRQNIDKERHGHDDMPRHGQGG